LFVFFFFLPPSLTPSLPFFPSFFLSFSYIFIFVGNIETLSLRVVTVAAAKRAAEASQSAASGADAAD